MAEELKEAGHAFHQEEHRETERTQRERHDQETAAVNDKGDEAGQVSH